MSDFTASLKGQIRKRVVCEKCQHGYEYDMERTGMSQLTPIELKDPELRESVQGRVKADLERKLKEECDVVPCPQCGALTVQMQEQKRTNRIAGFILFLLGVAIVWIIYVVNQWTHWLFYGIGLIGVILGLGGLWAIMKPTGVPLENEKRKQDEHPEEEF